MQLDKCETVKHCLRALTELKYFMARQAKIVIRTKITEEIKKVCNLWLLLVFVN